MPSTYPALLENYGQPNPTLDKLLTYIPKEVNSATYLEPALLVNYLRILSQSGIVSTSGDTDRLFSILERFSGGIVASKATTTKSEFYGYLLVP